MGRESELLRGKEGQGKRRSSKIRQGREGKNRERKKEGKLEKQ